MTEKDPSGPTHLPVTEYKKNVSYNGFCGLTFWGLIVLPLVAELFHISYDELGGGFSPELTDLY